MSYRAEVWVEARCIAHVTSWDAQQAVLRLFFGTSLVLPKDVRLHEAQPAKTNG